MSATIKATPTDGLCYDPGEELYWRKDALDKEVERVFDVCHGCRLCFNLCPSFPALFDAVDRNDGDVRALTEEENDHVVDECFQCKLCYVKCPYTADDGHEFDLDFPRLMQRYTSQKARREGVGFREKVLGNPSALGRAASLAPSIANMASKSKFHRSVMQAVLGIHRDKQLPEFADKSFEKWLKSRPASEKRAALTPSSDASPREVVLFHTCFVNYNNPDLGKDCLSVLERNGVVVHSPKQGCCGMPAMDGGDFDFAQKQADANVRTLLPFVERGMKVLAINPTCSYMLRKEYAEVVSRPLREDAKKVAAATRDVLEYLFELRKAGELDQDFESTPEEIAYHVPCHLKAQNIGFRSRDVMKRIPGAKVRLVDRCCGHDGTWAMKTEHFEDSMKVGAKAFDEMSGGGQMATDCPLAAIHFEQATGTRPLHPIQILERAYRAEGFATRVERPEEEPSGGNAAPATSDGPASGNARSATAQTTEKTS